MRVKPGFEPGSYKAQRPKDESPSCLLFLLISIIGYFVLSAIARTTTAGFANKADQYTCIGTLLGFVILVFLAKRDEKRDKQKLREARQEWKRTCKSIEVAILDRRCLPRGSREDEYGISHSSSASWCLDLEAGADQKNAAPDRTRISVKVNQPVYEQLQERKTVRIYYKPDEPMTFLLEEELA